MCIRDRTPAEQTGAPPSYANPYGENVPIPDNQATASSNPSRSAVIPVIAPTARPVPAHFTIGGTEIPLGVAIGVGAALLALVSLLVRQLIRAARTRRVVRGLTPEI